MELKDLAGQHVLQGLEHNISRVDTGFRCSAEVNSVKFMLDGVVYTCTEDPDDGYRSYMGDLTVDESGVVGTTFSGVNVNVVYVSREGTHECDIIEIIDDVTDKVILRLGTVDTDDYYPCCVCEYHPENMAVNIVQ